MKENKIKNIVNQIREEASNLKTLNDLDEFMTGNFDTEAIYDSDIYSSIRNSSWTYMIFLDDNREEFVEINIEYDIIGETYDLFENYYIKINEFHYILTL